MRWAEPAQPVRMQRVAVVAPTSSLRDAMVQLADCGVIDFDDSSSPGAVAGESATRLARGHADASDPQVAPRRPDLAALEDAGRWDLLAGEAELEDRGSQALTREPVAAWLGWMPAVEAPTARGRLAACGATVVALPRPRGVVPPTLLRSDGANGAFGPVVRTYGTVPYADVDPTVPAGLVYILMFGIMFADVGHGLVLVAVALLVRAGWIPLLARLRRVWVFLAGAGFAAMVFGAAYGEFFGPTGVLPGRWLDPLDEPVQPMIVAVGIGALLLAGAFGLGTVNRWREGGWRLGLYSTSGLAGAGVLLAFGLVAAGWHARQGWVLAVGAVALGTALTLAFLGLLADAEPGRARVLQASIGLFDTVVRLGSNLVSFVRLAAFGLMHAVLGLVVWEAGSALWGRGGGGYPTAVIVLVVGNIVAFALEALVAGVQALRLEYYELFSRVFTTEGRPFHPWHVPIAPVEGS